MLIIFILILFYFTAPIFLIYLCKISKTLNRIGAIVLAYILGLLLGNIGIFPSPSSHFKKLLGTRTVMPADEFGIVLSSGKLAESDIMFNQIAHVQDILMTIIIPLAIPLLLFSLDLRKWIKLAKGAVLSLILAMVSLIVSVFVGYYLFAENIDE